jgi:hypothetical protein
VILSLTQKGVLSHERGAINNKRLELGYNDEKFLQWFKDTHKDLYIEIFT